MPANAAPAGGVAIVIPARNAGKTLGPVLDDLAAMPLGDAEVVVVDDGSTDDTAALAKGYANRLPGLVVVAGAGAGPAAARNRGVGHTNSEWIGFVDADVRVPPAWLKRALTHTADADVIEGVVVADGGTDVGLIRHWPIGHGPGSFLTANLWVRRALFDRVGGFDEGYASAREDTDLGWRLVAAGARVVNDDQLVVFHPRYRRRLRWLFSDARKLIDDTRLRSKFRADTMQLVPRRRLRRTYAAFVLGIATLIMLALGKWFVAVGLAVATLMLSFAAVLSTTIYRGETRPTEWLALAALAPALVAWRVICVVRGNLRYREWFW